MRKQWRTRTRGSKRQIGKHFELGASQQKLKASLPRVTGKVKQRYPQRSIELKMIYVNPFAVKFREKHPVDLDRRAKWFMKQYQEGNTIPPILVHRKPDGKLVVLDGHARVEAYRRLRVKTIPAVENLDLFKKKDRSELYHEEKKFIPPVISSKAEKGYDMVDRSSRSPIAVSWKAKNDGKGITKPISGSKIAVEAKPLVVIPPKPKTEAQKAWKPKGYEFTQKVKEKRKGAIVRGIEREGKRIGRGVKSTIKEMDKPVGVLSRIEGYIRSRQPQRVEVTHKYADGEVRPVITGRERTVRETVQVQRPRPLTEKEMKYPFATVSPLLARDLEETRKRARKRKKARKPKKRKGVWTET